MERQPARTLFLEILAAIAIILTFTAIPIGIIYGGENKARNADISNIVECAAKKQMGLPLPCTGWWVTPEAMLYLKEQGVTPEQFGVLVAERVQEMRAEQAEIAAEDAAAEAREVAAWEVAEEYNAAIENSKGTE